MQISTISQYSTCSKYANFENINNIHNRNTVRFLESQNNKPAFRGAPWRLDPYDYGVSSYGDITAGDAIKLYDKLSCGNYLDIGDDKYNFYRCNNIREENLHFLDRVASTKEKEKFINYYKELTGFPNLKNVSEKIKTAFTDAVSKSSRDLYYSKYNVEQAGYDGICSVGRGKALPGSDLDKAYVIIKGDGTKSGDIDAVNRFKESLWFNTDQRILSYNHDEAAFPQVYTKEQIRKLSKFGEAKNIPYIPLPGMFTLRTVIGIYNRNTRKEQRELMDTYLEDYVEANPYYIEICDRFEKANNDSLNIDYPSKENIKNVGFVFETMREGETFSRFGHLYDSEITNSDMYKYSNLSQLHALKNRSDRKPKRLARESLQYLFPSWSIDKQFRCIKALIMSACANNKSFTTEFAEYFSKPGQDLFEPLIRRLMR